MGVSVCGTRIRGLLADRARGADRAEASPAAMLDHAGLYLLLGCLLLDFNGSEAQGQRQQKGKVLQALFVLMALIAGGLEFSAHYGNHWFCWNRRVYCVCNYPFLFFFFTHLFIL